MADRKIGRTGRPAPALPQGRCATSDGSVWKKWNGALGQLSRRQREEGCARGSWDPVGAWGADGGRVHATATMVLMLEVYYRYGRRGNAPGK